MQKQASFAAASPRPLAALATPAALAVPATPRCLRTGGAPSRVSVHGGLNAPHVATARRHVTLLACTTPRSAASYGRHRGATKLIRRLAAHQPWKNSPEVCCRCRASWVILCCSVVWWCKLSAWDDALVAECAGGFCYRSWRCCRAPARRLPRAVRIPLLPLLLPCSWGLMWCRACSLLCSTLLAHCSCSLSERSRAGAPSAASSLQFSIQECLGRSRARGWARAVRG